MSTIHCLILSGPTKRLETPLQGMAVYLYAVKVFVLMAKYVLLLVLLQIEHQ